MFGAIVNINGIFTTQAGTQWLDRATGGLLVWLGVKLALAQQH